ncbi:MAG: SIMPL domain-containing protein [Rikenellaceae bacterium]
MANKSTILISSIIISLGMVILGAFLKSGIISFKESERVVLVKGLSERTVEADNVIWPIKYEMASNNLTDLYASIETNNAKIIKFLEENGISKDEVTVPMPIVTDLFADRYANTSQIKFRYNISSTVIVSSKKVNEVRKAMDNVASLIKDGLAINSNQYGVSQVRFTYSSLNDIKPEMIEEATKSAREAAEKFAKDSDSDLGKIKTASQGQFSINDRDINTPYIKTVRVVTTVQYFLKD